MKLARGLAAGALLWVAAAAPASAAIIQLKFYNNGGPGNDADTRLPTLGVNCNGSDVCGNSLTWLAGSLSIVGTATRGGSAAVVIHDLQPPLGGVGVDGDPWGDNIAGNEVLRFAFSRPVRLIQLISFRDHNAAWLNQNQITVTRNAGADQVFTTPLGPAVGLTRVTFDYAPNFWGSAFTYRLDGQDSFYVSELLVETRDGTVPEPALPLLLGGAALALARSVRKRALRRS